MRAGTVRSPRAPHRTFELSSGYHSPGASHMDGHPVPDGPGVVFRVLQQYSLERGNAGNRQVIVGICRWSKSPNRPAQCRPSHYRGYHFCTSGQHGARVSAEQLARVFRAQVDRTSAGWATSRTSGFWRWAITCSSANRTRRRSRSVCSSADKSTPFAIRPAAGCRAARSAVLPPLVRALSAADALFALRAHRTNCWSNLPCFVECAPGAGQIQAAVLTICRAWLSSNWAGLR